MTDRGGLGELVEGAVVAATDGSETSLQAIDWAAEEAKCEGRPLTLVHATGAWDLPPAVDAAWWSSTMQDSGEELLSHACSRVQVHHRVPELRSLVVVGDPRTVLLEASERAHVLVMGSRGRGPVKSLLFGSVGIAMAQHARCPVVLRRPPEDGGGGAGVLVGTDLTKQADPAVAWAFNCAANRETSLTLLHAVFDGRPAEVIRAGDPQHASLRTRLEQIAEEFRTRFPSVAVECQLRRGLADEALALSAIGKDLVVVGRHSRRSVLGLLDLDVTRGVVSHAPRLVAVIPVPID